MSRLQEIQNGVVQEYLYKSFEEFDDKSTFNYDHDTPTIIKKIAEAYAKECVKASLEKASENGMSYLGGGDPVKGLLDKKSITNFENIVLL